MLVPLHGPIERFRTLSPSFEANRRPIVAGPGRSFERFEGGFGNRGRMRMRTVMRKTALAVSLVFAAATIVGSAATAGPVQRDPACDQRAAANCAANWQALGWPNYELCVGGQQCLECPPNYGYLCPTPDIYNEYATEPTATEPR